MTITRSASAHWSGSIVEGKGQISTQSGALDNLAYGFATRFENEPGTNPEELIGAAHAGCYAMALSKAFTDQGVVADSIDAFANVKLQKDGEGFSITRIDLSVKAKVAGLAKDQFIALAEATKDACPVSKLLKAEIRLDAELLE